MILGIVSIQQARATAAAATAAATATDNDDNVIMPDSPLWPDENTWSTLRSSLSSSSSLTGPIDPKSYDTGCRTLGSNAYAISSSNYGICMHSHDCSKKFCDKNRDYNLPEYVVDARSESDIVHTLNFASDHNIRVSIKTTGHSYQGSSLASGSILLWMHHYPKDDTITQNYTDSCGTDHGTIIGLGGGETWDDVLEAVGGDYHIVTGGARTVSAVGGWLQGSGLSFTSREYGLGVDQLVDFRVVLPNASVVVADACTNSDLFWALRGGGGGTFGVVTHASYKLHPKTEITTIQWGLLGIEHFYQENIDLSPLEKFAMQWLQFWSDISPDMNTKFGGFFNIVGVHLVYAGPKDDEDFINLLTMMDTWYSTTLDKSQMIQGVWGALPPSSTVTQYDHWYHYKGGPDVSGDPTKTDPTGEFYEGITSMTSRLVPKSLVQDRPDDVVNFLFSISESLGIVNYFLGGKINSVPENATSVHPALRQSLWSIFPTSKEDGEMARQFLPNNITGACFNHHNPFEPDWRNALWGSNYEELLMIKKKYDPNHRFNPWHSVGYVGEEFGDTAKETSGSDDANGDDGDGYNVDSIVMALFVMMLSGGMLVT